MNTTTRSLVCAAATAVLLTAATTTPVAAATGNDIEVVNTETVQIYTDATGKVQKKRIYEQLALTGTGNAHVENPAVLDGLRNLQGFGGFTKKNGKQIVDVEVDGRTNLRTVSTYKGDLPLTVRASYTLNGKTISPADLVGRSGELEASFTVTNTSAVSRVVSYDDGAGNQVKKRVAVPVPIVGSLTTILPPAFRDVASQQANMAGDGRGNTKLSFTMTLIPPIGQETVTFGYTATVDDAVVPRASITALPVNPLESPSFKTAGASYQNGARTGADLADGALQIDTNLLKLRDGAGDLLAGLIKLRDGATELSVGLTEEAAPGAAKVADGAAQLRDGLGQLDDGAGKLAGGSQKLAEGTGKAAQGGKDLTAGLAQISDGLGQLAGTQGLPGAAEGIKQLQAGVKVIQAGIGDVSDKETLIGGLAALEAGLTALLTGSGNLLGGLQQLGEKLPAAKAGVDQVKTGLGAAVETGGSIDQLIGGLKSLLGLAGCSADPVCVGTVNQLVAGATASKSDLTTAAGGLGQVSDGLGAAIAGLTGQLIPGAAQIQAGLADANGGAAKLSTGAAKLKGGVAQVGDGLTQLSVGITKAVAGVLQLSTGATAAHSGAAELSGGLTQLDDGATELAKGAGQLVDGTGDASAGSSELADGAGQLADGLGGAADGSKLLAEGLGTAADGVPAMRDGAQQLSTEGSQELVKAGKETAQEYGEMYAVLEAGAQRAVDEAMVIGAPDDAIGLAAYNFEMLAETGESSRNLERVGLGAALALMAGVLLLLRRRLSAHRGT